MAKYKNLTTVLRMPKGVKVFFDLKVGVTRGEVPDLRVGSKRD